MQRRARCVLQTAARRQRLTALVCGAALACLSAADAMLAAERAPVVAVTPFKQFFDKGKEWDAQIMAVRDQVVAELVRDYDCVVLNRSYGYSVALEDAIKRLGDISEQASKPEALYGADYSCTGMFQPGVANVECVLRLADLRSGGEALSAPATRVITVSVPAVDRCASLVAREIARAVKADRRAEARAAEGGGAPARLWAVLAFAAPGVSKDRLNPGDRLGEDLRVRAELALQRDARARLVDHSALEQILKEQAMGELSAAPPAGRVARLAGADRLLLGCVSGKAGNFTIDLLGVDAETSEVIGVARGQCGQRELLGEEVEKAVGALLESQRPPSRLSPCPANQRNREARFYLESAGVGAKTYSLSGNLAVIEFAEMAYLVARDDPAVVGGIVQALSECNRYGYASSPKIKRRIAEVADRIVRPFPEVARTPEILQARAQAYAAGDDFETSRRLMGQFAEAYPDRMDDEARRLTAESLLGLGRPREALEALAKDDDHSGSLRLRLRCYRALGDEGHEFELMDKMTHRQLRDLLERYLELLAKRKGPQSAVEYIELSMRRDSWLSAKTDVRFLHAKYRLAAGDKAGAAALCQQLWDEGQTIGWEWVCGKDCAPFKERLEALRREAGASDEKWLKACEVQQFPAGCALYLQPLGQLDANLLEHTRAGVQSFFGARTGILPSLALSKEERSYIQKSNKYDAALLLPDLLKRLRVPSDALAVVMVTRENICADGYAWIYSRRDGRAILCSCFVWLEQHPDIRKTCLRNSVVGNICGLWDVKGPFPCITASTGDAFSSYKQKFALCPKAQELYKAVDLVTEQRRSIKEFRAAGVEILDAPVPHGAAAPAVTTAVK